MGRVAACLLGFIATLSFSSAEVELLDSGIAWGEDDECKDSESCTMSVLQVKAVASSDKKGQAENITSGLPAEALVGVERINRAELQSATGRRRRHHTFLYPTTKHREQYLQPHTCAGVQLVPGQENCCAGHVTQIATTACCGEVPYYYTQLSCCVHGDGTATLYDPYSQNCCDDEAKLNAERGICDVPRRATSCCQLATGRRRRRVKHSSQRALRAVMRAHAELDPSVEDGPKDPLADASKAVKA